MSLVTLKYEFCNAEGRGPSPHSFPLSIIIIGRIRRQPLLTSLRFSFLEFLLLASRQILVLIDFDFVAERVDDSLRCLASVHLDRIISNKQVDNPYL